MPQNNTIKFFISSTFKDFLKERNALQNFVFPRLKNLCQSKGFSFQPVDLRWGVTEESSEDNKTMDYCLNEVRRCSSDPKPNLLILFGQRYGWGPLPSYLTVDEYNYISGSQKIEKLEQWYIQDKNDIQERYFLKEKKGYDRKEWEAIEKELKEIIQNATIEKKDEKEYERFHTSATEQEIKDALEKQYKANSNNTIVYFRKFKDGQTDDDLTENTKSARDNLQTLEGYLLQEKITSVKKDLVDIDEYKNLSDEYYPLDKDSYGCPEDIPKYLKDFCESIYTEFKSKILDEIDAFNKQLPSPLKIELSEQERFLEEKSQIVIGRNDEVKEIINFVKESKEQYYLLYGKSGSGKTAVMASTIKQLENENILYKFIGTTAHTTSPRDTYEFIYWKITDPNSKNKPSDIDPDDQKFYMQFQAALERYSKGKKLTLFIDAVDQFNSFDSLEIFLSYIPSNVKIVFSVLYDESKTDNDDYITYYKTLEHIKNTDSYKELEPLDQNSNIEILKQWLEKDGRKLSEEQNKLVKKYIENQTPLYLRLMYEIVREWKSSENLDELEKQLAYTNEDKREEELILKFFENVVKKHYVKEELLELTLGLISASKDGLSESELIDLLSNEPEILSLYEREGSSYPKLERFPDSIFSKMYYHIQDIFTEKLIDDEMLINPYHRIIEEVIKEKYYEIEFHAKLADYFKNNNNRHRRTREASWNYFKLNDNINLLLELKNIEVFNTLFDIFPNLTEIVQYSNLLKRTNTTYELDILKEFKKINSNDLSDVTTFYQNFIGIADAKHIYDDIKLVAHSLEKNSNHYISIKYLYYASILNMFTDYNLQEKLDQKVDIYKIEKDILEDISIVNNNKESLKFHGLLIEIYKLYDKSKAIEYIHNLLNNVTNLYDIDRLHLYKILASQYKFIGKNIESINAYQESLEISQKVNGKNSVHNYIIKSNLATIYRNEGNFTKAKEYLLEAINFVESQYGMNDKKLSTLYYGYARLYDVIFLNNIAKAEKYFNLSIKVSKLWKNYQLVFTTLTQLGQLLNFNRRHQKAISVFQDALILSIKEQYISNADNLTKDSFSNIGTIIKLYHDNEDYCTLHKIHKNMLKKYLKTFDKNHWTVIVKKLEMIYNYWQMGYYETPKKMYLKLIPHINKTNIDDTFGYIKELTGTIAEIFDNHIVNQSVPEKIQNLISNFDYNMRIQNFEESYKLIQESIRLIVENNLLSIKNEIDLKYGQVLSELSVTNFNKGDFNKAKPYMEEYYDFLVLNKNFGKNHPNTIQIKELLKQISNVPENNIIGQWDNIKYKIGSELESNPHEVLKLIDSIFENIDSFKFSRQEYLDAMKYLYEAKVIILYRLYDTKEALHYLDEALNISFDINDSVWKDKLLDFKRTIYKNYFSENIGESQIDQQWLNYILLEVDKNNFFDFNDEGTMNFLFSQFLKTLTSNKSNNNANFDSIESYHNQMGLNEEKNNMSYRIGYKVMITDEFDGEEDYEHLNQFRGNVYIIDSLDEDEETYILKDDNNNLIDIGFMDYELQPYVE